MKTVIFLHLNSPFNRQSRRHCKYTIKVKPDLFFQVLTQTLSLTLTEQWTSSGHTTLSTEKGLFCFGGWVIPFKISSAPENKHYAESIERTMKSMSLMVSKSERQFDLSTRLGTVVLLWEGSSTLRMCHRSGSLQNILKMSYDASLCHCLFPPRRIFSSVELHSDLWTQVQHRERTNWIFTVVNEPVGFFFLVDEVAVG